jgi:predicted transposase/invertase (TIGR01784 family)
MTKYIDPYQKAFITAELAGLTAQQRDNYEQSLILYRDMKSVLETAVEENKIEIAKKLIKRNLTNDEIAEDTGLTVEQIEELRKTMFNY